MTLAPSEGPNHVPVPLLVRLPLAAALVWWGATTDRRWTVPVAATLALPTIWIHGLAMLVAAPLAELTRGETARPWLSLFRPTGAARQPSTGSSPR